MRTFILCTTFFGVFTSLQSQTNFKHITNAPYVAPQPLQVTRTINANVNQGRIANPLVLNQSQSKLTLNKDISTYRILSSGSLWIELKSNEIWQSRNSIGEVMQKVLSLPSKTQSTPLDWIRVGENADHVQQTHIRIQQTFGGYPIKGQDMILHIADQQLKSLNGFAWTGHLPGQIPEVHTQQEALVKAKEYLVSKDVHFQEKPNFEGLHLPMDETSLIWYPKNGELLLAYKLNTYPNAIDHWIIYIDAVSLTILEGYSETCSFAPKIKYKGEIQGTTKSSLNCEYAGSISSMPVLDGASVTTDQDLLGQNRTVNGYQVGSNFFMIDASRTTMYQPAQSVMPNDPVGVIWTIDAQNTSPQQSDFEVIQVANSNNNWKNLEVSAHYNAGQAFEYYRTTFNRNSINGDGGNIISIINVTDENDNNMDNAFWNGAAMYYGNGDVAYTPLAKGLDVGGHEMSHGVIDNTANLEYVSQSGALNESYADVFGAMIDRDDWRMGEDVVKLSFFPSGALRDLSDPHNGGNGPNDNGWQPGHMNEYQNLAADDDNGGVHVNSGIPNHAFFFFANSIGKAKAEQVYYKALTDYLVKSSQFIDMRLAVEKAATDLYGANSPEVIAARSAFDQVGIGNGQGGDYEGDIDTNTGDDFILATDVDESDLYFIPPGNPDQYVKMNVPAPISRPSFTDDGSACVYVDAENNMIVLTFNWAAGLSYGAFYIENNPQGIWRNVAVSKDGTKIAYTTANLTNDIYVYDYNSENQNIFPLFNPTTAGGINSEDVLYADALEWDYSGEYLMYDALNRIESAFGDGIEYWDIAFINIWNNASNDFGPGLIGKLYSALPENSSIGNPSFAKNSPYIITFDFVENYLDGFGTLQTDYWVVAGNIESGVANNIFHNNTIGYPSYSRLDDKILFTNADNGSPLLATIRVQAADKTVPVVNSELLLATGGYKGVWFQTGDRIFTATNEIDHSQVVSIWPQPAREIIQMNWGNISGYAEYKISDLSGRFVQSGSVDTDEPLQVASLLSGIYFISLRLPDNQYYRSRFVKQ